MPGSIPDKVVEYPLTTDYHWPQFDLNNTDAGAEGSAQTVLGPFQFKNAVELDKSKEKVKPKNYFTPHMDFIVFC